MHFGQRLLLALLALGISIAEAADFSTINSDRLANFWAAAESTNRPVTVVSFGDSMADSYRSPSYCLMNKFYDRLGSSGFSLNNYRNAALINLTNGAFFLTPPGELWYHFIMAVPPGGAVWWERQWHAGVLADQMGLFWIAQPQGGAMRFQVSTNGGPWTTALALSGYSASPMGCYTNFKLSPDLYRVRVETDTGTNYILGNQALLAKAPGLHAVFMDFNGISLASVTNVLPEIRNPLFAALKPDLLIWHMKEDGSAASSNRMEVCEAWWRAAAPDCDVLYIGTPWVALDTNSSFTLDQNTVVRSIALKHQRAYVDLMQPMVSYPWMLSQGYNIDGTHLSNEAGMICAEIMWNDVGFFALGLPRELSLTRSESKLSLAYDTSAGAVYQLQISRNRRTWTTILTNPVVDSTYTTNFEARPNSTFFRLKLSSP